MLDDLFFGLNQDDPKEDYPGYFYKWDDAMSEDKPTGYFEAEQLIHIVDIYFQESENDKARKTIEYALAKYPDNEDLLYEILVSLSDYELWNDLFTLTGKYRNKKLFWIDGHRLEALFHLGMEDEAFQFFSRLKEAYTKDADSLSVLYQAMGESLLEVGLNDAAILVLDEAIKRLGEEIEFLWLQIESYVALENKEKVVELGTKIGELSPFDPVGWHRLGLYYSEIKKYDRAIEAFEFAQDLNFSDSKKNLFELISAHEKNGNIELALKKTKEYLHLYPESYFVNLSAALLSAETGKWEEAIGFLDKVINIKPEMDALYAYKASFLVNLGEIKKAKATLTEGIQRTNDPDGLLAGELGKIDLEFPEY